LFYPVILIIFYKRYPIKFLQIIPTNLKGDNMKLRKRISILIIFCYSILIVGQTLPVQNSMQIVNVLDKIISGDKGTTDNISEGAVFYIHSPDSLNIGTAKVILVKENMCALEIIDLPENTVLTKGFFLTSATESDSSEISLLVEAKKKIFTKEKIVDTHDYYFDGTRIAEAEYGSSGAVTGGLLSGFALGLIGWGIGYLIISNKSVKVPEQHLSNLEQPNQIEFTKGYTERVKSKRNNSFHVGAAIGTLAAVIVVSSLKKK
jgi:hypothetical protein